MMKSNLGLTIVVILAIVAMIVVIAGPPVALSLYFAWPYYVYEFAQAIWGAVCLASFYGMLGLFK